MAGIKFSAKQHFKARQKLERMPFFIFQIADNARFDQTGLATMRDFTSRIDQTNSNLAYHWSVRTEDQPKWPFREHVPTSNLWHWDRAFI